MSKDYTPLRLNNLNIKKAYGLLQNRQITEASTIELFNLSGIGSIPFREIIDIEIGTENTKESIVRLPNNNFIVLNGTIEIQKLRE